MGPSPGALPPAMFFEPCGLGAGTVWLRGVAWGCGGVGVWGCGGSRNMLRLAWALCVARGVSCVVHGVSCVSQDAP